MLGSNVPAHPSRGGLSTLFKYAIEWQCECIQSYITLSRRWKIPDLPAEDVADFKSAWRESRVKEVVAHAPLIVNLASPDHKIWKKSIDRLTDELDRTNLLGIKLLVLHPGYRGNSGRRTGIDRASEALNQILGRIRSSQTMVLLETMAGQGTSVGSRFDELVEILDGVDESTSVGICFDTCHVFAAGYDIRGYQGYERVLDEIKATVGLEKIRVIHLNDSKNELGSRVDRHTPIGEGKLGLQLFHSLVSDPKFKDIPKILEIPTRDGKLIQQQLEFLRELQKTPKPISEPKAVAAQTTLDRSVFGASQGESKTHET